MTEIKFENPLDYSVENIEFEAQKEVEAAIFAFDKHLDAVEKREAELLTELEKVEAVKQGDTGKISTLAGITRAAKETVTANPEQIKTELKMLTAFKMNEAVPLLANLATASGRLGTEVYKLHASYAPYLSLQTIEAYDKINAYLSSFKWDIEQSYSDRVKRAGFKESNYLSPSGHSVLKELRITLVTRFDYHEALDKLQAFVNIATSR